MPAALGDTTVCPHPTEAVLNHQACPRSQAKLTAPTERRCLATQLAQQGTKLPMAVLQHMSPNTPRRMGNTHGDRDPLALSTGCQARGSTSC